MKRSTGRCMFSVSFALTVFLWGAAATAFGAESAIDTGDTAWVLTSTALVMLMTVPGLAFFYGGLVRGKNVLGTVMQCFVILSVVSLTWVLWGYSLAFAPSKGGIIGGLDWIALNGVGTTPHESLGPTIPHQVFMLFQLMFAGITPALITGAFAERMRFTSLILFTILWTTLIYSPLAHWVWGGGWIGNLGALDFAGGAVVHISSGMAALACAMMLGKREGYGSVAMPPHNLPLTLIGTGLLWFGWFGFNAGSGLGANETAVVAFAATHIAAAAGALGWMTAEWLLRGKPTVLGVASGVIAGLATITPGAGFLSPLSAILIGFLAGCCCFGAVILKDRMGYDDSLDVVAIHGVGGVLGILMTGLIATIGVKGLFFGGAGFFGAQVIMILSTMGFVFIGTWIILKIVDLTFGLRINPEEEREGLDLSQHGEQAYSRE